MMSSFKKIGKVWLSGGIYYRECCKDDRQSQWGMAKFDPQPTLKPCTDRHQIWNTWLCRRYLLPKKLFRFIRAPTDEPVRPIFAFNTSHDVVLHKKVPFGVRKINFQI